MTAPIMLFGTELQILFDITQGNDEKARHWIEALAPSEREGFAGRMLTLFSILAEVGVPGPLATMRAVVTDPAGPKPLRVATETQCTRCQAVVGQAGTDEDSLIHLAAMASRHTCLPRIS